MVAAAGLQAERRLVRQCLMLLHQVLVAQEPWVVARGSMVGGRKQSTRDSYSLLLFTWFIPRIHLSLLKNICRPKRSVRFYSLCCPRFGGMSVDGNRSFVPFASHIAGKNFRFPYLFRVLLNTLQDL